MSPIHAIEEHRLREQGQLDQLKTAQARNRLGQFATPPTLALDIAQFAYRRWSQRSGKVRFLDPAIGTGSFYSALRQVFPEELIGETTGIELDPDFARTASGLWSQTGLEIMEGDFTKQEPPSAREAYNLILANPPYVRHHHLAASEKTRLKALVANRLGIHISGLAGLYCYFLLLCDAWLADDGLAIWLIPSEFMDVNYGDALKRYLTRHVRLLRVHRFCPSDVQFSDALVSSAIVIFEKSPALPSNPVVFSFGGSLLAPRTEEAVPLLPLRTNRKWTAYPTDPSRKNTTGTLPTLGDLFTIKRGLATGANEFFILPRNEAIRRGIPRECTKPVLPSPRFLPQAIIESDEDGYPRIESPLSLIDCSYPEEDIQHRFPAFWDYLRQGLERGVHQGYLASRRDPWYSQEDRPPAPFLCTYMGRADNGRKPFRFLWNRSEATACNVYLLLYPKGPLRRAHDADPAVFGTVFTILQAIDTCDFVEKGRVYGGGLYKMEPKELARISAKPLLEAIAGLSAGRQMHLFE